MAVKNSLLSSVYNYYQADLTPKSSRFDSHKKKDLQKVYRDIVKLSKDEPVFLMDRSKALEDYTIHMKENAISFRNNIAEIGGLSDDELFSGKRAFSSDPDKAEITGSYPGADDPAELELDIKQLAGPQENRGHFLEKDETDLAPGNYSFDISNSTSTYELQFTISESDKNIDIQRRMARLINNFNLGLSAEVVENQNDEAALVIHSTNYGNRDESGGHFSISDDDTSQRSGIVDYFGIKQVTDPGHDAVFSVNGTEYTSPVNEVTLDGRYSVTLKETTDPGSPLTIGIKPDYESIRDNIISLAGSYNAFLRATAEYVDVQPRTNLFVADMKWSSHYYTDALSDIGVTQDEDGNINVDDTKLTEVLKNGEPTAELDTLKDFTRFALRKAEGIQLNPMDYVDKRIVAYKNPTVPHYANPYVTSAYSGMLFNSYM